jgi:hypothetical protein
VIPLLEKLAVILHPRRDMLLLISIGAFVVMLPVAVLGLRSDGSGPRALLSIGTFIAMTSWGLYLIAFWFRPEKGGRPRSPLRRIIDPSLGPTARVIAAGFVALWFGVALLAVLMLWEQRATIRTWRLRALGPAGAGCGARSSPLSSKPLEGAEHVDG